MNWIRARQPAQKEERRQSILDAATDLLRDDRADRVSLGHIASRCGFAKSNVYRYFESKEEIFLTLYLFDTEQWIRSLAGRFSGLPLHPTPDAIADLVFEEYQRIPRLGELLPWVYLSFAPALSPEFADQFRELDRRQNDRFVDGMLVVLPDLDTEAAGNLFRQIRGALAGLGPMLTWRSDSVPSAAGASAIETSQAEEPATGTFETMKDTPLDESESPDEIGIIREAILHLCRETLR